MTLTVGAAGLARAKVSTIWGVVAAGSGSTRSRNLITSAKRAVGEVGAIQAWKRLRVLWSGVGPSRGKPTNQRTRRLEASSHSSSGSVQESAQARTSSARSNWSTEKVGGVPGPAP